jgi:bacteriorhodopsin
MISPVVHLTGRAPTYIVVLFAVALAGVFWPYSRRRRRSPAPRSSAPTHVRIVKVPYDWEERT